MRTFKSNRNELVMLVIKISTAIILCLLLLNALNVMAQSMPNEYGIGQGINLREKVRQIYTSQIGIREKPVNSGPQVEKYLKYVGLGKGNPWCAAFVCWVLGEAGVENPRSGWSPDLFAGKRVIWQSGASAVSRIKNQESRLEAGNFYKIRRNYVDGITAATRSSYRHNQTSYFLPLTSAFQSQTSVNCPIPTSDFRLPTSNKPPISFTLPTPSSDLRLPTSHKPPVSFTLPTKTSDFRLQTSDTRRSASPPRLATDNWQLTTSPSSNKTPLPNPPTPTTGDIFGLYFPEKGRISHTGFIDHWDGTWMISVEGNTNIAGSREGDGVYRKRRLVRSVSQVARYINY